MQTSDSPDLAALLPKVRDIAVAAGAIIHANENARHEPMTKADGSQVTRADQLSEDYIVEQLKALTPDIPIISEEAAEAGTLPKLEGDTFWLVDPLDGTALFIRGEDGYSVNIALIIEGHPALGVLSFPAQNQLFGGAGSGTAFQEDLSTNTQTNISTRTPPPEGPHIIIAKADANRDDLQDFLKDMPHAEPIEMGGTEKFYKIARGDADIYVRFGKCYEWDVAAGHAILEAAGGSVTTIYGAPYEYGAHKYLSVPFVVRGQHAE